MRLLPAFILALALQDAQQSSDPPYITVDKSAPLQEWVSILEEKFGVEVSIDEDAELKDVKATVRDGGFFQALDAVCGTHGNLTYFYEGARDPGGADRRFYLKAVSWKTYPVHYSGHFKTILTSFVKFRESAAVDRSSWVEAEVCVMAPPWHNLEFSAGTRFVWELLEALDSEGKDVRSKKDRHLPAMLTPSFSRGISGNVESETFALRDFDLDKGLKVLSGKVSIKVADSNVVRIPLKAAAPVVIPGGTLKFESAQEYNRSEFGAAWRIAFTYRPEKGDPDLDSVLENQVRYDGHRTWHFDGLRGSGRTFEIETFTLRKEPQWVEFRVRKGERTIEVPFQFKDVVLKVK